MVRIKISKMSEKQGFLYSLEALIAALLIFLTLLFAFRTPISFPQYHLSTLEERGYTCLRSLEKERVLRTLAIQNETGEIESKLESCMPPVTNFRIQICRSKCTSVTLPENVTRISVDYFLSGKLGKFDPLQIILIIWGGIGE